MAVRIGLGFISRFRSVRGAKLRIAGLHCRYSEAIEKIGAEGLITVEEAKTTQILLEIV